MIPRVHHSLRPPAAGSARPLRAAIRLIRQALMHAVLAVPYLVLAALRTGPGLSMHRRILALACRALVGSPSKVRLEVLRMVLQPMDSVRYFEFDFAWRCATSAPRAGRLLDVSSPRCFTLTLLRARSDLTADLANPDPSDAATTRALVAAAGLEDRCRIHGSRIEDLRVEPASYDLVSCISVIEHIPGDRQRMAVERLWSMVRAGGRLVLTVPVARSAFDEYLDFDEYGLLGGLSDGWVFGQRFHDASTLDATVFDAIGPPSLLEIVGERCAGYLLEDRARKMAGEGSPWREPYAMATELTHFATVGDLPGWGVACMEFVKPEAP